MPAWMLDSHHSFGRAPYIAQGAFLQFLHGPMSSLVLCRNQFRESSAGLDCCVSMPSGEGMTAKFALAAGGEQLAENADYERCFLFGESLRAGHG